MTFLQVTQRIPFPLTDGGAIAMYHVTKYMKLAGHDVILASLNTKKHFQDPEVMSKFATVYTTEIDTSLNPFDALNSLIFSEIPYNIKRFLSQDFSVLLTQVIKKHQPEVIQLEGLHLCLYADLIKSISNAPIILRAHNVEYEIWDRYAQNEKNLLKKIYLRDLTRRIKKYEVENILKMDGIIAITEKDAKAFQTMGYKGKLITVPTGVSEKWLQQPFHFPEKVEKIGFLGSLEWLPNVQGLEWFIEKIWIPFYKKNPSIQFHIAGRNPLKKVLDWKYPGVIVHGEVKDAIDFLNQFQILVIPLLSGSGMRVKLVESLALGKCVITTPIGAEGVDISPNQHAFISENPTEWIKNLENLIQQKDLRQKISINAREFAACHYEWSGLIQKMILFYQQLIPNYA